MKKHFLILAASLALGACSNGDDMPQMSAAEKMTALPVAFHVGVAEATTRAGYPAGTLAEGAMGFYMQTAGANSQDARYNGVNRKVEYKNSKWTLDGSPLLWRNKTDEVSWQAYYPYSDANITDGIIPQTVPTNQDSGEVNDFLYGNGSTTGEASANGIGIVLKHQMSKLIVKLDVGTELGDVEIKSVVISGMNTKWAFDIFKGRWDINSSNTNPADIGMLKDPTEASGQTFEAIILPLNPDQFNIDITTTDNRKFYYKRGNTHFKEGQVHTLNLKVGKDKVETAAMTAADWADDGRESTLETN